MYLDEFHSAICLFDNDTHSGVPRFISRLIFRLAEMQLRSISVKFHSVDPCDWTLVRMLRQTYSLRLQDEFAASLLRLPSLSGLPQVREIANSGMLCFAMRVRVHASTLIYY